jgi:hypothetical protein
MRFMMLIKSDPASEAGVMPDEKTLTDMGNYNEALAKAGLLLGGEGLKPSAKGARVQYANGKFSVIDGPFAEAKEVVAGYWTIQAKSKEDAIAWVKRAPDMQGEIELRPLFELDDFPVDPAEKPDGWRDQEQQMRDDMAAKPAARKPGTKRYILFVKSDATTDTDRLPSEAVLSEMGALMEDLAKQGAMLGGEGLKPSKYGARVLFEGKKRTVIDGPFTESKELIAGFLMMQAKTRQEVLDLARGWLDINVRALQVSEGAIEVRELFELEDFPVSPDEKPDGWREQEQALRNTLRQ